MFEECSRIVNIKYHRKVKSTAYTFILQALLRHYVVLFNVTYFSRALCQDLGRLKKKRKRTKKESEKG